MEHINEKRFTGERAEFSVSGRIYENCIFADGESPLKHSSDIELIRTSFQWKYPLWYAKNIRLTDCSILKMGRAGIWYSENIELENTVYEAPKGFRRVSGLRLRNVDFPDAEETLWNCSKIEIDGIVVRGNYFAMNCSDVRCNNLRIVGDYCFDGCRNVEINNSKLLSKDAFWNCENVVVKNSYITGEYLAWNSRNVTFINCVIESLQGLCYVDELKIQDCRLINTTYAFEYSDVDAKLEGRVESILNPSSGRILSDEIGELIIESDRIDERRLEINSRVVKKTEKPEWL